MTKHSTLLSIIGDWVILILTLILTAYVNSLKKVNITFNLNDLSIRNTSNGDSIKELPLLVNK